MAQKNSQEPDSGISSGVSDNPHSPMQCSENTEVDENNTSLSSYEHMQPINLARGLQETRHTIRIILEQMKTKEDLQSYISRLYEENQLQKMRLATKEEKEKHQHSDVCQLQEMLALKDDNTQRLISQLGKVDKEKIQLTEKLAEQKVVEEKLKKQLKRTRQVLGVFLNSSPRSVGAILLLLDWTVREFRVEKQTAHNYLQEIYKEASPNPWTLPSFDDLEALRQKWISWYNKYSPPCFIKTVCVWYEPTCPEVPFFFYNFNPDIHDVVTEPFVNRHFFNLLTLDFDQRKEIPELYEKRYVLCCYRTQGIGHMCVVSKEELDVIKSDNHVGFKFRDQLLQEAIEQNTITRFIICLPRGDMSNIVGTYKITQVSSLQQLNDLLLSEPEYKVKITHENSVRWFDWKKTPGQHYSTSWSPFFNFLTLDILVEVYLDKGNSPFP